MSSVVVENQLNKENNIHLKTTVKVALQVEYNGTRYNGFQLQDNAPTIQAELEEAICKLTGEKLRVIAASRTDTGVHARGQIVSFRTHSEHTPDTFVKALNYHLPQDIAVKAACNIDNDFDIRKRAISREYEYYILNTDTRSPLMHRTAWLASEPLNVRLMEQACELLIGKHDFASFTTAEDIRLKSTVKTVHSATISKTGNLITFRMIADAFLHHQVRNTIGALTRVGTSALTVEEFGRLLDAKTPGAAGPKAPACGLCLIKVNYTVPFEDRWETSRENLSR